jgi:hypothetical protein
VFEGSGVAKDRLLTGDSCTIPPECIVVPGSVIKCGIYGVRGDLVTPTIYCEIGKIERGADPSGDESTDPSLPVWAQLQAQLGDIAVGKVSVTDIINNLTTNVTNKPLSAAQGAALKALIDGLATGKLDASKLTEAINTALEQAKASGEFDGEKGDPGTSVTVKSVSESTADGGSNVVTFSDGKKVNIKNGKNGKDGKDGKDGETPSKGTDYWTPEDKAAMVSDVLAALPTETWQLTLIDGAVIEKRVVVA